MARTKEIGIIEFLEEFKTEEACREYLYKKRFPEGFICPRCGYCKYSEHTTRNLYQCRKCQYQASITAGTIFHKTHLPLKKWFLAMFLVSKDKRGYSAMQLSKELDIPYKTSWFLLQRLRTAMGQRDSKYMLSGVVEFDDTYFGGKKKGGKRGRGTTKTKVLAAVSKTEKGKPQYLKMQVVPNLKGVTIGRFSHGNIQDGSQIQTDAIRYYKKPLSENFSHIFEIFDAESGWLHWLHVMIGNAKSFVNGTFHGLGKKHLQLYLDEFCYRFNRRYMKFDIFHHLAGAAVLANPITFKELK